MHRLYENTTSFSTRDWEQQDFGSHRSPGSYYLWIPRDNCIYTGTIPDGHINTILKYVDVQTHKWRSLGLWNVLLNKNVSICPRALAPEYSEQFKMVVLELLVAVSNSKEVLLNFDLKQEQRRGKQCRWYVIKSQ